MPFLCMNKINTAAAWVAPSSERPPTTRPIIPYPLISPAWSWSWLYWSPESKFMLKLREPFSISTNLYCPYCVFIYAFIFMVINKVTIHQSFTHQNSYILMLFNLMIRSISV